MNVYVESNFVLELTLLQREHESCEGILRLCEQGRAKLIIPAYAFAEPNETLGRRDSDRKDLALKIGNALKELGRSIPYEAEATTFQGITSLLTHSVTEERQRLTITRERLLTVAEVIPLNQDILRSAIVYETQFKRPQDALIFASVLLHLKAMQTTACFIARDEHFEGADIKDIPLPCKFINNFNDGLSYIQSQL